MSKRLSAGKIKTAGTLALFRGPFRVVAFCGLGLMVAILVGTAATVRNFRANAIESENRSLESAVFLLARHFDQQLRDFSVVQNQIIAELESRKISSPSVFAGVIATLEEHEILRSRISGWGDVAGVSIFSANGVLITTTRQWPVPDIRINDRSYFKTLASGAAGQLAIEFVQGKLSAPLEPAVVFARPIFGSAGAFLGVVTRVIDPKVFETFFQSVNLGEHAAISIHRAGQLLARHPRIASQVGASLEEAPSLPEPFFQSDHLSLQLLSPIDGQERLVSSKALSEFPLVVAASTTVDAALAEWRRQTQFFLFIAIVSLIVIAVVMYFIVRQMSRSHERSKHRLNVQTTRLKRAINHMTQGLLLFDASHRLVVYNDRYLSIYGLSHSQVKPGGTLRELITQRKLNGSLVGDVDDHCALVLRSVRDSKTHISATSDGRLIQVANELVDDGGWLSVHDDITEQHQANERISHFAHHDALTDLPNRIRFRQRVDEKITGGTPFGVLYIDVDQFKTINDSLGHHAGDELLKTMAVRLKSCLGTADVISRLGGDEFAIVREGRMDDRDLVEFVDSVFEAIRAPCYLLAHHHVNLDASIGISRFPDDGTDLDSLMKSADLAMFAAKTAGRRVFRFFEPAMRDCAEARRELEMDLRAAIREGSFEVHYQPLVDLRTDEITCCEALLRWRHPIRGMVSPAVFIPIAEATGLIAELGEWVLKTACIEAVSWLGEIKVAVNVSPIQLKSKSLSLRVISALAESGLSANRLELEITEAVLIADDEDTLAVLNQLRDLGINISLDDFGTGYSSLSYLQRFPFDKIKIDRSFVKTVTDIGGSAPIIQAVVSIAKARNMTTTAEGVERIEQRDLVRDMGCTHMQGYFFSAARPAVEIRELLNAQRLLHGQVGAKSERL